MELDRPTLKSAPGVRSLIDVSARSAFCGGVVPSLVG